MTKVFSAGVGAYKDGAGVAGRLGVPGGHHQWHAALRHGHCRSRHGSLRLLHQVSFEALDLTTFPLV